MNPHPPQSKERPHRTNVLKLAPALPFLCSHPSEPTDSRPAPWVGGVLFISTLGMLNMPLIFTVITGMDQYGIFTIDALARRPMPLILATTLNIAMTLVGYMTYRRLWMRQERFTAAAVGPFKRALALIMPPVLVAFAPSIIFASDGGNPLGIVVAFLIIVSLSMTTALGDRQMRLDPSLARTWMSLAFATIVALLVLSMSAMWIIHEGEQVPAQRNLFWDWNYEWHELGYSPEEFGLRQNDALRIFTPAASAFMIGVLGIPMLGAMWRWARPESNPTLCRGRFPQYPAIGDFRRMARLQLRHGRTLPHQSV